MAVLQSMLRAVAGVSGGLAAIISDGNACDVGSSRRGAEERIGKVSQCTNLGMDIIDGTAGQTISWRREMLCSEIITNGRWPLRAVGLDGRGGACVHRAER